MTPQQQQVLAQMNDIQIPDAIGWWPPSHLMLVVIVGLSGLVIWMLWYQWVRYRSNLYRKEGVQLLKQQLGSVPSQQEKILLINTVLKQVAITNFGRHKVASLTGQPWLDFLQSTSIYMDQPSHLAETLRSAYGPEVDPIHFSEFLDYAEAWIKGHHK